MSSRPNGFRVALVRTAAPLACALALLALAAFASAASAAIPEPRLIKTESEFEVVGMNDSGQMVGTDARGWPHQPVYVWTPPGDGEETGTFSSELLAAPFDGNEAQSIDVVGIGNNGAVAGTSSYTCALPGAQVPPVYCGSGPTRATWWGAGGGAGTVAGSVPGADSYRGFSHFLTMSPSGASAGGRTGICDLSLAHSNSDGCALGNHAMLDGALFFHDPDASTSITSRVTAIGDGGLVAGQWDGCPADPDDPLNESDGVIFGGDTPTCLHMNPRVVLADGTIYADLPMTVGYGTRVREPDGTVDYVGCGADVVHDANEAGEVLVGRMNSTNSVYIKHQGTCYPLRDILPDGYESSDWSFPRISGTEPQLTADGRIAAYAWYRFEDGEPEGEDSWEGTVLITPKYPTWVRIEATPTDRDGEYDLEWVSSQNSSTSAVEATKWEISDEGSDDPPYVANSTSLRHRFQTPGRKTVKVTVDRANGTQSTHTTTVLVEPPELRLGVTIPGYSSDDEIPVGTAFKVVVSASASEEGVGELRDLTYQGGGLFTPTVAGVLDYTTAAIPPFSLAPGDANVQEITVVAKAPGEFRIRSVLVGKDESDGNVSALHQPLVTIVPAPPGDDDGGPDPGGPDDGGPDDGAPPSPPPPPPPTGGGTAPSGTADEDPAQLAKLRAPARKRVALAPRQRLRAIARLGSVRVRMPATQRGVRVKTQLLVNARHARRLGLRVPRRARAVAIGSGRATMKRRGTVVVNVKLTRAGKRALTRTRARAVRVTARVTLTRRGYRGAAVARPLVLRR